MASGSNLLKIKTYPVASGNGTYYVGRCFRTDFRVQTQSSPFTANSMDLVIPYNPTYIQPYSNSTCTSAATSITSDNLSGYFSWASNSISGNQIQATYYNSNSDPSTDLNTTDGLLAHVWWKVIAAGSYSLSFDYTPGSTIDTNMGQRGEGGDKLDGVENLTLDLRDDTTNPTFTSPYPASAATNISITTGSSPGIYFTFSDSGAGISTTGASSATTLTSKLSGTTKSLSYSNCTTTDSNRTTTCKATLSSVSTMDYYTWYSVAATGSDVASPTTHSASTGWWFQTEDDTDDPWVTGQNPASGAVGVSTGSNIVLHVKDYKGQSTSNPAGLGVDISSVQVAVTPAGGSTTTYTYAGAHTFSSSCTSPAYDCTITISGNNFPQYKVIAVAVDAQDLNPRSPNVMTTTNYSFTTADTGAPTFSGLSPASNAVNVAPSSNVVLHILDTDAGVDLDNTTITVAGTAYTKSGADQYAYSCTGSNLDCTFTVDPASNFTGGQNVTVSISTQDRASTPNTASLNYNFTVNNVCTTCSVDTEDPARFTTTATLDNTISFHIKDSGSGIRDSSIKATLVGTGSAFTATPLVLTGSSPLVGITGTSADYLFLITLPAAIEASKSYSIVIEATDINGVTMNKVGYSFSNLAAAAGTCSTCSVDTEDPARFTTSATLDSTISFHIKDSGAGIRNNSIKVTLTGTGSAFTATPLVLTGSSPLLGITGTSADYLVTVTLPATIEANKAYSILIEATDVNGNTMNKVAYSFAKISETVVSSSCASSACVCSSTAQVTTGGGNRGNQDILSSITSAELPVIVARRRLPGNKTIDEPLPDEVARKINRCYVDETEATHAAAAAEQDRTGYLDVPAGIWYEEAVTTFLRRGILDVSQKYFRGNDPAARSEMAKVLVKMTGVEPPTLPKNLVFDDADRTQWYAPFTEQAAKKGWMLGYGNCAGTHPCYGMPDATITRAEAIAMIVRYTGLKPNSLAPQFPDVVPNLWYAEVMKTAADHCIVQGDPVRHLVRPAAHVTRAELIVMLDRAQKQLIYGQDCSWGKNQSSASNAALPSASSSVQSAIYLASSALSSTVSSTTSTQAGSVQSAQEISGQPNPSSLVAITFALTGVIFIVVVGRLLL
jgi:hypothetical protein